MESAKATFVIIYQFHTPVLRWLQQNPLIQKIADKKTSFRISVDFNSVVLDSTVAHIRIVFFLRRRRRRRRLKLSFVTHSGVQITNFDYSDNSR